MVMPKSNDLRQSQMVLVHPLKSMVQHVKALWSKQDIEKKRNFVYSI